ncbi:hypothetical protein SBRY_50515 [Actinacidiphila bryophytorum]|uniref:Uncharacterized protein n=1 Tax=Actinacidiphila bryophytorum TaxID=1436133 RepID=A0A9W4MEZ7_9ACTN|nr:hypothetical protein SBRY_50515 [Actinacidiphila bryophytorum]
MREADGGMVRAATAAQGCGRGMRVRTYAVIAAAAYMRRDAVRERACATGCTPVTFAAGLGPRAATGPPPSFGEERTPRQAASATGGPRLARECRSCTVR